MPLSQLFTLYLVLGRPLLLIKPFFVINEFDLDLDSLSRHQIRVSLRKIGLLFRVSATTGGIADRHHDEHLLDPRLDAQNPLYLHGIAGEYARCTPAACYSQCVALSTLRS